MPYCARQMDEKVLDSLEDVVKTKYEGPSALNPESLLLNLVMMQVGGEFLIYTLGQLVK